jgi:hypothetical protein
VFNECTPRSYGQQPVSGSRTFGGPTTAVPLLAKLSGGEGGAVRLNVLLTAVVD